MLFIDLIIAMGGSGRGGVSLGRRDGRLGGHRHA